MTLEEMIAARDHFQAMIDGRSEPAITVVQLVARYMASVEFRKLANAAGEEIRFRLHLVPLLGDDVVASLTGERIAWYRSTREAEKGATGEPTRPATRNREVKRLAAACAWAVKSKIISANPLLGMPMEEEDNVRMTCPSLVEVNRIVLAARSVRLRAMVISKFHSGLRVSELLSVRLDQVSWDEGLVILPARQTKGKKLARITILPAQASRHVRQYLDDRGDKKIESPLLFCTSSGKRISRRSFLRYFQDVADRAGVKGVEGETLCLHDLRSGFVGRQLEIGTQTEVIKAMIGHTTDSAFRRYVRVQRKWIVDARERTELAEIKKATRRPPRKAAPAEAIEHFETREGAAE